VHALDQVGSLCGPKRLTGGASRAVIATSSVGGLTRGRSSNATALAFFPPGASSAQRLELTGSNDVEIARKRLTLG
jgi:hypothetical protein